MDKWLKYDTKYLKNAQYKWPHQLESETQRKTVSIEKRNGKNNQPVSVHVHAKHTDLKTDPFCESKKLIKILSDIWIMRGWGCHWGVDRAYLTGQTKQEYHWTGNSFSALVWACVVLRRENISTCALILTWHSTRIHKPMKIDKESHHYLRNNILSITSKDFWLHWEEKASQQARSC